MPKDIHWGTVVVLGAAGKMGRGISLLLLQELAKQKTFSLILIDNNSQAFVDLKKYLYEQLVKQAERSINFLRQLYHARKDLIDNSDMIQEFCNEAMNRVRFATSLEESRNANLVFEAIIENVDIKSEVLKKVALVADPTAYFFTNTSSIPIAILQEKSQLQGRLVGFHFYNPPAVQKLLEIIIPKQIEKPLAELATQIAQALKKTVVFSKDIAGFIGNGHFIREVNDANHKVTAMQEGHSLEQAIWALNKTSQDFLLRPMGIFQLIDYVGIDVCHHIASIMRTYLPDNTLPAPLVEKMYTLGVCGGQNADGSQKDGFFHYEKGKPVAIYEQSSGLYRPLHSVWTTTNEANFGLKPLAEITWKSLSKESHNQEKLAAYFNALAQSESPAKELAIELLMASRKIAHGLVSDGVAETIEDVDTVLKQGFFHLYGVDEPFNSILNPLTK